MPKNTALCTPTSPCLLGRLGTGHTHTFGHTRSARRHRTRNASGTQQGTRHTWCLGTGPPTHNVTVANTLPSPTPKYSSSPSATHARACHTRTHTRAHTLAEGGLKLLHQAHVAGGVTAGSLAAQAVDFVDEHHHTRLQAHRDHAGHLEERNHLRKYADKGTHTQAHVLTNVRTSTRTRTDTRTATRTRTCARGTRTRTHMHTYKHSHTHARTRKHTHTHTHTHT